MTSAKHFHLIVPVWGKTYTELFTDVCLPMLLTPGNLGALGKRPGDQFVIVTTWDDYQAILDSSGLDRLKKMIPVEFVLVDSLVDLGNSHKAMSECYAMAMHREAVVPGETCFLFLTPDSFWPDGTFKRLVELADQDFKVVMAGGLRVKSESMSAILRERIARSPDNPAIPLSELISLALANIHQLSTAFNLLSKSGFLNMWPSHMYWINERDQQFVAHCFHLHPLLVVAPRSDTAIGTTIDGEFLNNLHYPLDRYYVIQEEFVAIELTPAERNWGQPLSPPSVVQMVRFSLLHANSRHWYFFGKRIVLNGSPGKPIDPLIEILVDKTVRRIQKNQALALIIQKLRLHLVAPGIERRMGQVKNLLRRLVSR
ncbi:MAG: hypothetical protein NTX56_20490 [Proteobacteria bacterium]|nr:hypothetical protein [Pseudomonadota bacterium]